jgi:hypothetical protein
MQDVGFERWQLFHERTMPTRKAIAFVTNNLEPTAASELNISELLSHTFYRIRSRLHKLHSTEDPLFIHHGSRGRPVGFFEPMPFGVINVPS